ncbi:MAG: hypothetical protein RL208_678 [Pseudomonadota bacterium]|jgi:uncharacterized protein (TIGR02217 family)
MKFLDIKFPDSIASSSSGGPEFSTSIATMQNKNENRNANWQQPRFRYQLSSAIKSKMDYETVKSFFLVCKGREFSFRFKDFADYKIEKQFLTKVESGVKEVQIFKTYAMGNLSYKRKITKIVPNSVLLFADSNVVDSSLFTVDNNTGIITLKDGITINSNLYISCEFDVQVRFDTDNLLASFQNAYSISLPEITLIEVFN